jgi:hypothetical protein
MLDRLLHARRRRRWPTATASLVSATFHDTRSGGSYEVAYTFWVEEHIYSGAYWESGSVSSYNLKPNDPIPIQYDPQDPNNNFNPDYDNNINVAPVVVGLAFVLGIVAVIVMAMEK